MSKAHDLLALLNLTVVKGAAGRYPATDQGPSIDMRYWATELTNEGLIQFGAQMKRSGQTVPPEFMRRLRPLGFKLRPNGREIILDLPGTVASAKVIAENAIRQLEGEQSESKAR